MGVFMVAQKTMPFSTIYCLVNWTWMLLMFRQSHLVQRHPRIPNLSAKAPLQLKYAQAIHLARPLAHLLQPGQRAQPLVRAVAQIRPITRAQLSFDSPMPFVVEPLVEQGLGQEIRELAHPTLQVKSGNESFELFTITMGLLA